MCLSSLSEVTSQVFDIQKYSVADDLSPTFEGMPLWTIPLWMPTVMCKLAFLADVPALSSRVFLIYYHNEKAMAKTYRVENRRAEPNRILR